MPVSLPDICLSVRETSLALPVSLAWRYQQSLGLTDVVGCPGSRRPSSSAHRSRVSTALAPDSMLGNRTGGNSFLSHQGLVMWLSLANETWQKGTAVLRAVVAILWVGARPKGAWSWWLRAPTLLCGQPSLGATTSTCSALGWNSPLCLLQAH